MNNPEMSSLFDVLYNNITSNQAPGLNEAEKSVFLTKGQNMLVKEEFNSRTDGVGGGFDGSQQRQYDFSSLIRVASLFNVNTYKERIADNEKLDKRSLVFLFPKDYFLTVNEVLSDPQRQYSVLPLSYDEYQRLMLKPYNFPVKRGAWRLITDKKNCNYIHTDSSLKPIEDLRNNVSADYVIETTWADQKRKVELTLMAGNFVDAASVAAKVNREATEYDVIENYIWESDKLYKANIYFSTQWSDDNSTYRICIGVLPVPEGDYKAIKDDEQVVEMLKEVFKGYKGKEETLTTEYIVKACVHLDGMEMCSAPSRYTNFFKEKDFEPVGATFTTHVIQIPLAEVIGKFNTEPNYQLRYVKKPRPIVLEDLDEYDDEFSIDGVKTYSECELPSEMHQEVVERAVTLAKIAWQGGTVTQAASQQRQQ